MSLFMSEVTILNPQETEDFNHIFDEHLALHDTAESELFDNVLKEDLEIFFERSLDGSSETRQIVRRELKSISAFVIGVFALLSLESTIHTVLKDQVSGPIVATNSLPSKLPEAVKRLEGEVGQVIVNVVHPGGGVITPPIFSYLGSGIRINSNYVITAGHMFDRIPNTTTAGSAAECYYLYFDSGETAGPLLHGKSSDPGTTSATSPDVGVAKYSDINDGYTDNPPQEQYKVANRPLKIGEKLFFINYEPTADGSIRYPNTGGPAVFGGVYLGKTDYGDYEILSGLKSYGAVKDTVARPGASGGAVFTADGTLVGLSVKSSIGTYSAYTYEHEFGVKLLGKPSNQGLPFAVAQPINPDLVHSYESRISQLPGECNK